MAEPAVGMCVSHNLQLVRRLGSGAMASVWLARHRTLGIERAVKFLCHELAADDDIAKRFDREAKAIARIRCPHVVEVFDNGQLDCGLPYIVTELLEGEDLAELITRTGSQSLEDAATLVAHVATALDSAHALGIIHRDLKPGNIFVLDTGDDPVFKVLDFGIAKAPEPAGEDRVTLTKTGHAMGTPGFMSPEQWLNAKGVTHKSDLWALGAVAYCAVTNEIPFDAESPTKAMFATCAGNLPPASDFNPDVPPELDAWFAKAMSRHAEDRFESAGQMARAFVTIIHAQRDRVSLSDRPTMMMPERITPTPDGGDREEEADTPSVAPVALSTVPSEVLPPAGPANRNAWRRRATSVTRAVIGGLAMTAILAAAGAATSHELETRASAAATPMLARTDRASVRVTGVCMVPR